MLGRGERRPTARSALPPSRPLCWKSQRRTAASISDGVEAAVVADDRDVIVGNDGAVRPSSLELGLGGAAGARAERVRDGGADPNFRASETSSLIAGFSWDLPSEVALALVRAELLDLPEEQATASAGIEKAAMASSFEWDIDRMVRVSLSLVSMGCLLVSECLLVTVKASRS